jgi:fatty acid desaturase
MWHLVIPTVFGFSLQLNPRMHPHMLIKSFIIIFSYIFFYYMTFFGFRSTGLSMLFAVGAGLMAAQVGASIMHDANHGTPYRASLCL